MFALCSSILFTLDRTSVVIAFGLAHREAMASNRGDIYGSDLNITRTTRIYDFQVDGGADTPTATSTSTSAPTAQTELPSTSGTAESTGANIDTTTTGISSLSIDDTSTSTQGYQGADRPTQAPTAAETSAINDKTDAAERVQSGKSKVHDVGGEHEANFNTKDLTERTKNAGQEGGGALGKEKGTREEWVKSSGETAEGGDFDATKPGAGKEATSMILSLNDNFGSLRC
jgi:hypothetical protein